MPETPPTIRTLSCGAGVQSTAIALLMRDGRLPLVDHVIFADTGWEPARVYAQIDRLAVLFDEVGIPLHWVSQGNLREDAINPEHRFASVPYFVRNPDGSEGMGRRQCTSEYKLAPINRKVRELLDAPPRCFGGFRAATWPRRGSGSPPTRSAAYRPGRVCCTSVRGTRCWSWA